MGFGKLLSHFFGMCESCRTFAAVSSVNQFVTAFPKNFNLPDFFRKSLVFIIARGNENFNVLFSIFGDDVQVMTISIF